MTHESRVTIEKWNELIFDYFPIPMCICTMDGIFLRVNPAFCELLGYQSADFLKYSLEAITYRENWERDIEYVHSLRSHSVQRGSNSTRLIHKDSHLLVVERHICVIECENRELSAFILQVVDMTSFKQAESNIRFLAFHDPLTGLCNRVQFQDKLAAELIRAKRERIHTAVVFIDLDRFKLINDTLGHQAGDLALQEVGRRLQKSVRHSDTVARFGGDEFTILLPNVSDKASAAAVAEKLMHAISTPICLAGHIFDLRASAGVAVYPEDGQDADSLIEAADQAMYYQKRSCVI